MTKYLIAPYIIQVKTRGTRDPAKPLANIDGRGTSLETAVGNVLSAMLRRKSVYQDRADPNKQFMLSSVRAKGGTAYLLTVEPGRKGLQSTLQTTGGGFYSRTVGDIEYVPLRHLLYFPPNGHSALVFAERHGKYGAISFVRSSIHQVLTENFHALTTTIHPLTTLEALESATYNKIVFRAPLRRDASGRFLDRGPRVDIRFGFKHRRRVKELITPNKKFDPAKVFGILTDEGSEVGLVAPNDTEGWEANLTVDTANGRTRTFKIGDTGPALVYPVNGATINGDVFVSPTSYPSDEEFIGVCNNVLEDISGEFDIQSGQKLPFDKDFVAWDGSQNDPWEVTYYDNP